MSKFNPIDKIEFTPEEELERATWELNIAQQAYFKALMRVQQERDQDILNWGGNDDE